MKGSFLSSFVVNKLYMYDVIYHFQAELESEGLRNQKISFYDNKKTVDLLLNVSG